MTPSARGRAAPAEQVGRCRGADRDEDPTPRRLDEPRGDELIQVLGHAGERAADREDRERGDERPPGSPQVGDPAGERHHQDVHEQVAVDDPARLAQLDPGRGPVRVDEIGQDRWQRDRRDHQLQAREEHPGTEHREQRVRRTAVHDALRRPGHCEATRKPMCLSPYVGGSS